VCRFRVAAGKAKHWTRHLINCLELSQASKHHLQSFGFFPFGSIYLGFLLRENLAVVLIIPSSWGSQLDGAFHNQHSAASASKLGLEESHNLDTARLKSDCDIAQSVANELRLQNEKLNLIIAKEATKFPSSTFVASTCRTNFLYEKDPPMVTQGLMSF
jgi:hypothetical protein